MNPEPIFHSHMSDVLPDDHPLATETVFCLKCKKEMLHASNNECMQTWVEIYGKPFCLACALPCFQSVMTYAPLWDYLEDV